MNFKDFWKKHPFGLPEFAKAAMTDRELGHARTIIREHLVKKIPAYDTIKSLQREFSKLRDESSASRVYWTESKKMVTKEVVNISGDLGFEHYKVILSPSACHKCREKTNDGAKIFDEQDTLQKSGEYGKFVPFHPGCYCIVVPYVKE